MGETGEVYERCPACEAVVREGDSYCSACGESLPRAQGNYCRKCGSEFDRGDEYCSACGEARYPSDPENELGDTSAAVDSEPESAGSNRAEPSAAGTADTRPSTAGESHRSDSHVTHAQSSSGDHEEFDETYSEYRSRVNHYLDNGWSIEQQDEGEITLAKRNFGDFLTHLLLFVFTFFFTGGLVNLAYALYAYHVGAKRTQLVRGVPETRPVRERPNESVRFPMYVFGLFTMLLSLFFLSSGGVGIAIGGVLLLVGTLILPPVFERVQRRKSPTRFGTVTSTEDRTVEDSPGTCVVCGVQTTKGLEREYKKEHAVAGIPVHTISSGTNRYCPSCGLEHALGNERSESKTDTDPTESEPGSRESAIESVGTTDTEQSEPRDSESYIERELDAAERSSVDQDGGFDQSQQPGDDDAIEREQEKPGDDDAIGREREKDDADIETDSNEDVARLEEETLESTDE